MDFGELRRRRIAAGLPQAAIAQAAGRSLGWIYAVERGLTTPSRADADKIAELLGTSAEHLFSRIREEAD